MNMADTGIAIGNNNEYVGNIKCSHEYGRHPLLITCVIVRVTASLGQWREGLNMTRDAVSRIPKKLFGVDRLGKNVATNSCISCTVQHMFVLYLFTYMFIFKFLFMCNGACSDVPVFIMCMLIICTCTCSCIICSCSRSCSWKCSCSFICLCTF